MSTRCTCGVPCRWSTARRSTYTHVLPAMDADAVARFAALLDVEEPTAAGAQARRWEFM